MRNYATFGKLGLDIIGYFPLNWIITPVNAQTWTCSEIARQQLLSFRRANQVAHFFRYTPYAFSVLMHNIRANIIFLEALQVLTYAFFLIHVISCVFYAVSCGYFVPL